MTGHIGEVTTALDTAARQRDHAEQTHTAALGDVREALTAAAERRARAKADDEAALGDIKQLLVAVFQTADPELRFAEACRLAKVSPRTGYSALRQAGIAVNRTTEES